MATLSEFLVSLALRFEHIDVSPRTDAQLANDCRDYACIANLEAHEIRSQARKYAMRRPPVELMTAASTAGWEFRNGSWYPKQGDTVVVEPSDSVKKPRKKKT